jgi:hypothetical protein
MKMGDKKSHHTALFFVPHFLPISEKIPIVCAFRRSVQKSRNLIPKQRTWVIYYPIFKLKCPRVNGGKCKPGTSPKKYVGSIISLSVDAGKSFSIEASGDCDKA